MSLDMRPWLPFPRNMGQLALKSLAEAEEYLEVAKKSPEATK